MKTLPYQTLDAILESDTSTSAKLIAVALYSYQNRKTGVCNPSVRTLAECISASPTTVQKGIRELKDAGMVSWETTRKKHDRFNSNSYTLSFIVPVADTSNDTSTDTSVDTVADTPVDTTVSGTEPREPREPREPKKHIDVLTYKQVYEEYVSALPFLPKIVKWTDKRKKITKARIAEYQEIEWWKDFFERVKNCPHLIGNNDRGWTADFEWLMKEGNFLKVLEGKYDRKGNFQGSLPIQERPPRKPGDSDTWNEDEGRWMTDWEMAL